MPETSGKPHRADSRTPTASGRGRWASLIAVCFLTACMQPEKGTIADPAPARPPNFIVIVVDMLRPDHLGVYGYAKKTSPNLDDWARNGLVFDSAYSGAPWTYPSTVSLLTGLFPSEHGADQQETTGKDVQISLSTVSRPDSWLPRKFAEAGYLTAAFHSHRYLHESVSNIHEAFTEFVYTPGAFVGEVDLARDPTPWTDKMFVDVLYPQFETWLEKNHSRPFFAYLHLIDVHGPYKDLHLLEEDREHVETALARGTLKFEKQKGTELYDPRSKGPHKAYLYDGHMAVVDRYLGLLREKLTALGIAEDTYVVFTSDHGEGFGEHADYWGHGRFVFDTEARVPLIFLSHRDVLAHPRRISRVVSTVGLLPTLAGLAGVEVDRPMSARSFDGVIRGQGGLRRQAAIVETRRAGGRKAFMLDSRFKLIHEMKEEADFLYDLDADPGERAPLDPDAFTPLQREHFSELAALRERYASVRTAPTTERRPLDDEAVRSLRALGYLQ